MKICAMKCKICCCLLFSYVLGVQIINVPLSEWQGRFMINSSCVKLCVSCAITNQPQSLCSRMVTAVLNPFVHIFVGCE